MIFFLQKCPNCDIIKEKAMKNFLFIFIILCMALVCVLTCVGGKRHSARIVSSIDVEVRYVSDSNPKELLLVFSFDFGDLSVSPDYQYLEYQYIEQDSCFFLVEELFQTIQKFVEVNQASNFVGYFEDGELVKVFHRYNDDLIVWQKQDFPPPCFK